MLPFSVENHRDHTEARARVERTPFTFRHDAPPRPLARSTPRHALLRPWLVLYRSLDVSLGFDVHASLHARSREARGFFSRRKSFLNVALQSGRPPLSFCLAGERALAEKAHFVSCLSVVATARAAPWRVDVSLLLYLAVIL